MHTNRQALGCLLPSHRANKQPPGIDNKPCVFRLLYGQSASIDWHETGKGKGYSCTTAREDGVKNMEENERIVFTWSAKHSKSAKISFQSTNQHHLVLAMDFISSPRFALWLPSLLMPLRKLPVWCGGWPSLLAHPFALVSFALALAQAERPVPLWKSRPSTARWGCGKPNEPTDEQTQPHGQ